jgi:hypothetical protein
MSSVTITPREPKPKASNSSDTSVKLRLALRPDLKQIATTAINSDTTLAAAVNRRDPNSSCYYDVSSYHAEFGYRVRVKSQNAKDSFRTNVETRLVETQKYHAFSGNDHDFIFFVKGKDKSKDLQIKVHYEGNGYFVLKHEMIPSPDNFDIELVKSNFLTVITLGETIKTILEN